MSKQNIQVRIRYASDAQVMNQVTCEEKWTWKGCTTAYDENHVDQTLTEITPSQLSTYTRSQTKYI